MRHIFILMLAGTLAACNSSTQNQAPDSFTLKATITGLGDTVIYARHATLEDDISDTITVVNDTFTLTGKAPEALAYSFIIPTKEGNKRVRVFIENGNITLNTHIDSLDVVRIAGSKTQTAWEDYEAGNQAFKQRFDDLEKQYKELPEVGFEQQEKILDSLYKVVQEEEQKAILVFINEHPKSILSPYLLLSKFAYNPELEVLEKAYSGLDSTVKNSLYGKRTAKLIEATASTQPGRPAPEFSQQDSSGNAVALSSFKGKVVLVDFWASWCGPCRKENPNLVKAYEKYREQGFDILGVSLDNSKEKWTAAIAKDKLAWTQVSDLQGWNNAVAKQYFIKSIPANFLLDKDGDIIARNLTGEELHKKLVEVLQEP